MYAIKLENKIPTLDIVPRPEKETLPLRYSVLIQGFEKINQLDNLSKELQQFATYLAEKLCIVLVQSPGEIEAFENLANELCSLQKSIRSLDATLITQIDLLSRCIFDGKSRKEMDKQMSRRSEIMLKEIYPLSTMVQAMLRVTQNHSSQSKKYVTINQ